MASRFCTRCGTPVTATAKFCAECGHALTGAARRTEPPTAPGVAAWMPWVVPGVAIVAALAYMIGTRTPPAPGGAIVEDPGVITASDISALSPDERVDRLFNRVMSLAERGETDSVAFFAPMTVSALAAVEPLSAHRRYDLGLVLLVSGDGAGAQAQVDTMLAAAPTHLLALALGMRAATAAGDSAAARRFAARFRAAVVSERAKGLPEYAAHARDVDDALAEAEGRRTSRLVGER